MSVVDATLKLEGEFGERDLFELGEQLVRILYRGNRRVVVDFSGVKHLDYRGIRALQAVAREFVLEGGGLHLCGLSSYLKAIFLVAGRSQFEIFEQENEASAAFVQTSVLLSH